MRYLSVCSGIEAATVAWEPLGWEPAAFAEIDPFANAVLKHHYPGVPNAGDFTEIRGDEFGPIDLLVGGTPCQDFSVAGLRAGMGGARGALTLEFLRLLDRARPRWMVWENVPGVFSADGGRAFGAFLGGLAELGYGWAYRVLDAQYFGVPQRRRRVFVVGCFGDAKRAAAVLFERASLSGNPSPRRKARTKSALIAADGAGGGIVQSVTGGLASGGPDLAQAQAGWLVPYSSVTGVEITAAGTVDTRSWHGPRRNQDAPVVVAFGDENPTHALTADGFDASEDGSGRGTPLVPIIAFDTTQVTSAANRSNPQPGDPCHTLATGAQPPAIAFTCKDHGADAGEVAPTLRSMNETNGNQNGGGQIAVAFSIRGRDEGAVPEVHGDGDTTGALRASSGGSTRDAIVAFTTGIEPHAADGEVAFTLTLPSKSGGGQPQAVAFQSSQSGVHVNETHATLDANNGSRRHNGVIRGSRVRRLTPRECERLQGFPDDYTLIADPRRSGKVAADAPRYHALGNSMAVPVMRFIGERIAAAMIE